jgi:myosin I
MCKKSRVTTPGPNERNYHIFYQLARSSWASKFGMDYGPEAFTYCASSGCLNVEGMDDEAEFEDVLLAFSKRESQREEEEKIIYTYSFIVCLFVCAKHTGEFVWCIFVLFARGLIL